MQPLTREKLEKKALMSEVLEKKALMSKVLEKKALMSKVLEKKALMSEVKALKLSVWNLDIGESYILVTSASLLGRLDHHEQLQSSLFELLY
jgi:hypothetical protein